ncbi:uncharacterized protein YkwD [Paraburkholderia fungorum]|nr:uncharacterized protein YkwD [Paraburkholderia fungorum]
MEKTFDLKWAHRANVHGLALRVRAPRVAIASALFALLAACGGGGGSDGAASTSTNSGSGSAPTPAAVVSLLTPGGSAAATFNATGDMTNDTLAFFNTMRVQAGLPAVAYQDGVAHAALNHALYNTGASNVGHYETAGVAGFTGVDPLTRVNLYHATTSVGEVASAISGGPYASSHEAADGLFDAPFHRGVILSDFAYGGTGVALAPDASHFTNVITDFADNTAFLPADKLLAWPYPGQADAKTRWIDNEDPNPLAATPQYAGQVVGYPTTLTASSQSSFSNVSFTIADATGANVPCQEVDSSATSEAAHLAMCVPFAPLKPATAYTAKVSGTLTTAASAAGQAATARSFGVNWTFTTAAVDNVPPGTRPIATPSASTGATAKALREMPASSAGESTTATPTAPTIRFNAWSR